MAIDWLRQLVVRLKEIYGEIEKEASVIRYLILVLLGAGVNFSVGFGVLLSSIIYLTKIPAEVFSGIPNSTVILSVSYFFIGIVYSASVSLMFQPKRIISPLYIQVVTAAFAAISIVAITLLETPVVGIERSIDWQLVSSEAFAAFIIAIGIFSIAGIGQTWIVRYLVGLNGTKGDMNVFGLMVDTKLENVLKILRSDSVQEALRIEEERKTGKHSFVLRTGSVGIKHQFFLAVITDPIDEGKTQLATISYNQNYYGITPTGDLMQKQRVDTIKTALRKAKYTFSIDNSDSLARQIAFDEGLSVTRSKLLVFRSMTTRTIAFIIGMVVITAIVTALQQFNYITTEVADSFYVFAGLTVLTDLIPLLRRRRRKDE